ncbi:MAG: hypothetical protein HYZ12_04620 [Thaumarchaeota archaeon]|nr:hypothetical protein [Nitrososphaerota archaeon]
MYDFDTLVEEVLKQRPDIGRPKLDKLIEEKRSLVGGGYLTDQGALFLVAGELGIQLKDIDSSDLTLKDLYIGANDITVVARVLAVYPVSTYARKEGGEGRYRRLNLFDRNGIVRLTMWEDLEAIERLGVGVDIPLRVVSAYVKPSLDGKPALNLGKKGRIEVLKDEGLVTKMPSVSELERDIAAITETDVIAVRGIVQSGSKDSEFTRGDGSRGTFKHFMLGSENGSKQQRIVIWSGSDLPSLVSGERVRVTNLRLKRQTYGDPELHGDSGSRINVIRNESQGTLLLVVGSGDVRGSTEFLVADATRTLFHLNLKDKAVESALALREGDIIEVMGNEKYEDTIVCTKSDSVKRVNSKSNLLPSLQSLFVKVKNVEVASGPLLMEVVALSKASVQDVRLKDGSVVKKGELLVGDDTGEIKLAAWRESSEKLDGVQEGERLQIIGATLERSRMNTPIIQIGRISSVRRMKGASSLDDSLRL